MNSYLDGKLGDEIPCRIRAMILPLVRASGAILSRVLISPRKLNALDEDIVEVFSDSGATK